LRTLGCTAEFLRIFIQRASDEKRRIIPHTADLHQRLDASAESAAALPTFSERLARAGGDIPLLALPCCSGFSFFAMGQVSLFMA